MSKDDSTYLRHMIDGARKAIALAMELGDVFLILDDRKARQIAEQIGLKVIGIVGMLLRAKQKGVFSEIKPLLRALEEADFRISEAIVQKALQLTGEL